MCGFVGAVAYGGILPGPRDDWLTGATALLSHRGPDAGGFFRADEIEIGCRRLRIHDTDSRADQPLADPTGRYRIAFNGAIFNFLELRSELRTAGVSFVTASDTEVALQALATWGRDAFLRFDGMFAIAFHDRHTNSLLLGRDKLGIKPLFIHEGRDELVFASEVKPMLRHPSVPRALNRDAVPEFIAYQTVAPPRTLFRGIEAVTPGTGLSVDLVAGMVEKFTYWRVEDFATGLSTQQISVNEALELSLRRCWNADRPVGVQLSGGVDSSLIAALSHDRLGQRDIKTFSVVFDDSRGRYYAPRSEEAYIDIVNQRFGCQPHKFEFSDAQVRSAFAEAVWYLETPLNGASNCLYMLLAREVSPHVKVLITGEGADDIFLGYFADWTFSGDTRSLMKMFVGPEMLLGMFGPETLEAVEATRSGLVAPDLRKRLSPHGLATILTIKAYLHGLLARHDRAFMSHGVEGRPPFCTDEILAARFALADKEVQDGKVGKKAVKKLAETYFDHDFVYRRKIGFSAPFGDWCATPKIWRGYVDRMNASLVEDFSAAAAVRSVLDLPEGREKWSGQNLNAVFAWMNLSLWHHIFIDSADPTDPAAWQQAVPDVATVTR